MRVGKLFFFAVSVFLIGILFGISLGLYRHYSWPRTLANMRANIVSPDKVMVFPELDIPPEVPAVEVQKFQDFGALPEGQVTVSHDFSVKNVGTAVLKLQEISSTCRCTVAELPKKELAPGESVNIRVTVSAEDISGPFHQTVTFFTNDPKNPEIQLQMKGAVTLPVWADSPELNVGRIIENTPFVTHVNIFHRGDSPGKVSGVRFGDTELASFFEVKEEPLAEEEIRKAGGGAAFGTRLAVTVLPGLPQGAFQQELLVKTGDERRPELTVRLYGIVGDQLSIHGRGWDDSQGTLTLGRIHQEEEFTQTLWIIAKGEDYATYAFSVKEVLPNFVQVELGETQRTAETGTSRTSLTITIPAKSPKCDFFSENLQEIGCILLDTSKNENPLRIYLRFLVI